MPPSSSSSCEAWEGLPDALLEYIALSPLPTLVWTHPIDHLAPSFANPAVAELFANQPLAAVLPNDSAQILKSFLGSGSDRVPWDDSIDLAFMEPERGRGGPVPSATVQWKASRNPRYTVLTAQPTALAFVRWPTRKRSHGNQQVLPAMDELSPKQRHLVAGFAATAPVGLFSTDLLSRKLQWANECWWKVTGLDRSLSADDWLTRVHPDDLERLTQFTASIEAEPQAAELEFRWRSSDDVESWCVCVVSVQHDENGKPVSLLSAISNISKQKTAELSGLREREANLLRIRQQEEEFALTTKLCAVGLVRIDLKGRFLSVNDAWWDLTQLDKSEELNGCSLRTLTPLNIQFRWANGNVSFAQAVLNNAEFSKATGWIGSVTDVTARVQAEQAILAVSQEREVLAHKAAHEAESRRVVAVEEKREQELLVDVSSHELRNPISAILQNAELTRASIRGRQLTFLELEKTHDIPSLFGLDVLDTLTEDLEALDSIIECGMAQERIANDILGLAQIQLRRYNITPVEFDLLASLRGICRMFKTECRNKNVELRLVIGSSLRRLGPKARCLADPTRLSQILINLLSNAIRFTSKSATRCVTLTAEVSAVPPDPDGPILPPKETEYHIEEATPVYLFFSVEDTGPGMSQEATGRLFQKFMQASPLTHTEMGGSGLGLWIARNLCELQAGRIEVESKVGKGSIFRCFIAAHSVDAGPSVADDSIEAAIESITSSLRAAAVSTPHHTPGPHRVTEKQLRVLCVDDNPLNRKILNRQLMNAGHKVFSACDGQEALAAFAEHGSKLDCILMDVEMPVLDGLSATKAIRATEAATLGLAKRIRIVALTSNARKGQVETALESGMDSVVTKPYRVEHLLAEIHPPKPPPVQTASGDGITS